MIDTFKVRLKAKSTAAGANLSQTRIDAIADRLNKKFPDLIEEADHDAKIDDYYDSDVLKDFAKQDDRLRTLENKPKDKPKEDQPKPVEAAKPVVEQPNQDGEMPAWFKSYADKLDKIESEKKQSTISEKLKAHAKLKDVPQGFWAKWKQPEKEEEIDSFADEAFEEWNKVAPPVQSGVKVATNIKKEGGGDKVSPDMKNFLENRKKQNNTLKTDTIKQ